MNDFNTIIALLGGLILILGLISNPVSKGPLPSTLIALVVGILLGPESSTSSIWRRQAPAQSCWSAPPA